MQPLIKTDKLRFEYVREEGEPVVLAVDDVTLEIPEGSFTAIIGKNGSGKSTLAKNFNGLLLPTGGACYVAGMDTRDEERIWQIRQIAGMVFQNPDNQLISSVVEDDVAFGPENLGVPSAEIRIRVDEALRRVHMYEERLKAPHLLSGGQKQRIAIAGVVAMKPKCIILDEPTAMLDPQGREEVMSLIREFHREGSTIILITHFMEEAAEADRVLVYDGGKILMDGKPTEVFAREEEIRKASLSVPFPVKLAGRLRARGASIPEDRITDEALADYLAEKAGELSVPGEATYKPRDIEFTRKEGKPIIEVKHLTHVYSEGLPYETRALDDVSFDIAEGAFIGIIGHTGSGKSTMIQELNGLLKPKSGSIVVDGVEITDPKTSLRDIRKKVGLVFQYPEYQLFEETVEKDIAFGPRNLGLSEEEIDSRVREALKLVDLDYEEIHDRSPFELSGGQKRRVAIAGVIAMRPKVLIMDEPTAGLDPLAKRQILGMVKNLRQNEKMTILLVSHNMGDIAILADRVLVMDGGKLAMEGTPEAVFSKVSDLRSLRLGLPPATEFMELLKDKIRGKYGDTELSEGEGISSENRREDAVQKGTKPAEADIPEENSGVKTDPAEERRAALTDFLNAPSPLTLWQAEDRLARFLNETAGGKAEDTAAENTITEHTVTEHTITEMESVSAERNASAPAADETVKGGER